MKMNESIAIEQFFLNYHDFFTVDFFCRTLKASGVKLSRENARTLLDSSDLVFSVGNDEYITRAGVFIGRWFSFMPSVEEIQKGYFILGHRCMPFINPAIAPDRINVANRTEVIEPKPVSFSMNLALDTFALYGEGFTIPTIFSDQANTKLPLTSVQYGMPQEIELTAWPFSQIIGGRAIKLGDRILGRVMDWENDIVELSVLPSNPSTEISKDDIEREEWYLKFEKGLLQSFEDNGPADSIEQQLAFLFFANQDLCVRNCGSAEEFLKHTKKIGFSPYGVESRIWYANKSVPYIGEWNKDCEADSLFSNITVIFSPGIIDAYLEDFIFNHRERKSSKTLEELVDEIFPSVLRMTASERKLILLNIEKRRDILDKVYNQFADYKLAPLRQRVLDLFSRVSLLLCSIGCSGLKLEEFPQQELVILVQLFSHIARIVEEIENEYMLDSFPFDDVELSLEGMEDTYDEIGTILQRSLDAITYNSIKIVN